MSEPALRALATRLAATDGMVVVWSNADAAGYLKTLSAAVGPNMESLGRVTSTALKPGAPGFIT